MAEMNTERRVVKLTPQLVHLVDEKFQTFDLNVRARKAVDDRSVLVFRPKQFAQQQPHDFTIADELARILDRSWLPENRATR